MLHSRFVSMTFLLAALLVSSCSSIQKSYPENSDQYWSQLVKTSELKNESLLEVLKKENAHLFNQIERDAQDSKLLSFWGKSLNVDSGTRKQIIRDDIIMDLHQKFHLTTDKTIVHAGITHTYGYLFSVLDTPYGFKRKRWIEPTLNYAFAFVGNSLSPETLQGTLLSNLTYFAGKIAFKQSADKASLEQLKNVSEEVRHFDYSKLPLVTLEEAITHSPIVLRTTLVKLPFKREGEENEALLIYSVFNEAQKSEQLITAFPIKRDAYSKITEGVDARNGQSIAVRYNAYVEGLMDQKLTGTRKIR